MAQAKSLWLNWVLVGIFRPFLTVYKANRHVSAGEEQRLSDQCSAENKTKEILKAFIHRKLALFR